MLALIRFLLNLVSISPEKSQAMLTRLALRKNNAYNLRAAVIGMLQDDLDAFDKIDT